MNDQDKVYVRFRGRTLGPLTSQKVRSLVQRGQITRMHELSRDGLSWGSAEGFGDFFRDTNVAVAAEEPAEVRSTNNVPEAVNEPQATNAATESVEWYAHIDGENRGPVALAQIQQWKASGVLQGQSLVWRSGLDAWQAADKALPDLFPREMPSQQETGQPAGKPSTVSSPDLTSLANELNRRRGWAFFFGVLLIVIASFHIVGTLFSIFAAATADQDTVQSLIGGFVGIGFAGTYMTAGILLLQFCGALNQYVIYPTQTSAMVMGRRFSSFWGFVGIASLIWLVIFASIVFVFVSIGLSTADAFS